MTLCQEAKFDGDIIMQRAADMKSVPKHFRYLWTYSGNMKTLSYALPYYELSPMPALTMV